MLTLRTENHEWLKQHASTPHGMSALLDDLIQERRLARALKTLDEQLADLTRKASGYDAGRKEENELSNTVSVGI
jgi:hypothetical protein